MSKNRIAALGAGAAAALASSVLLAPAAVAQEDEGPYPSPSAFAIQASGLLDIPRTPFSEGTEDEEPVATVELPDGDPVVIAEALDSKSSPGEAKARIVKLALGGEQVPEQFSGGLEAHLIEASCEDGEGSINLAHLSIGGEEVEIGSEDQIEPNTGAEFDNPLLNITLNKQVRHDDGSLTVTAVSIELLDNEAAKELGINQTINLASATCSDVPDDGGETTPPTTPPTIPPEDDDTDEAEEDGTAPTPVPSPGHISVTG